MFKNEEILELGKSVFREEIQELTNVLNQINQAFVDAVRLILNSRGRVIISGIGKSANIGTKIVATLNSTGTPAIFMHAADAIHGDLGIVQPNDIVVLLSKSGNTPEIKLLIPLIKSLGNPIIAIVGNQTSSLATQADIALNTTIEKEACPNNLAPTSSTTAQLVMGDALAVTLLRLRGFDSADFARFHPGGALGKQLYMKVSDLSSQNEIPAVSPQATIREVILEISSKRLGATAVINQNQLVGIITDGDIRRMMQNYEDVDPLKAADIMSENPKTINAEALAVDAFKIMKDNNITQMLVVKNGIYNGVIHIHDILREGIL
ncbi:MAG: KpsF/GutQ family sugar-phosphate isomerase [Bacteroidales bacterium]|nr:KpsF/GutQ family sugar-phosphate isomerase [Bacteroidales bacterium]